MCQEPQREACIAANSHTRSVQAAQAKGTETAVYHIINKLLLKPYTKWKIDFTQRICLSKQQCTRVPDLQPESTLFQIRYGTIIFTLYFLFLFCTTVWKDQLDDSVSLEGEKRWFFDCTKFWNPVGCSSDPEMNHVSRCASYLVVKLMHTFDVSMWECHCNHKWKPKK